MCQILIFMMNIQTKALAGLLGKVNFTDREVSYRRHAYILTLVIPRQLWDFGGDSHPPPT